MSEITPDTARVVPLLQHELCEIGIAINPSETVALPPKGHVPTPEEISLLGGIGVRIAEGEGVKVVGVPAGNDAFAMNSALEIVRDGGAEQLARILPRMPDKQSANLIATSSMVQRTSYIERVMDPELSLPACQRADTSAMWMLERLLELPGTADESSVFEDGCPAKRLTLQPHQISQAILSTGTGGFGLSSPESRRMSASIGSLVATVPEVLADLSSPLGKMSGGSCPIRTSFAAYGVASGTFATSMGYRRRQWRTWSRKAGGTGGFALTRKELHRSLVGRCFRHMTAKRSAPTRRSTSWGSR